jgi:hypothetical protein
LNFCTQVREEEWYQDPGDDFSKIAQERCVFEHFKEWVETPCASTTDSPPNNDYLKTWKHNVYPEREKCCDETFPLIANKLGDCMYDYGIVNGDENNGVFFDRSGQILAIVYSFSSNRPYSDNFQIADEFYKTLKIFSNNIMATAETGTNLHKGFFEGDFEFYDLQSSIGNGVLYSALWSIIVAFIVLMLMTKNIIVTLYSCLTILLICGCCGAVLVLDGWKLNIIESIIFSVAIGMSVDFVAHLSHSYIVSPSPDGTNHRGEKVTHTLCVMGVSVSAAALTTFIAGLIMLFCSTLFFHQFGEFLAIVMLFGWFASIFFLMPLLAALGPLGEWGNVFYYYEKYQETRADVELLAENRRKKKKMKLQAFEKKHESELDTQLLRQASSIRTGYDRSDIDNQPKKQASVIRMG